MPSEPDFFANDAPQQSYFSSDDPEVISSGNAIVDALGQFGLDGLFKGNIVPSAWYETITTGKKENARADLPAILVLSEIVFRCRPNETITVSKTKGSDGKKRRAIEYKKRFRDDLPYFSLGQFMGTLNLGEWQVRQALARLQELGAIRQHLRNIVREHRAYNNVLYIELIPEKLKELSTITPGNQKGAILRKPHESPAETTPVPCGNHRRLPPKTAVRTLRFLKGIKTTTTTLRGGVPPLMLLLMLLRNIWGLPPPNPRPEAC